MGRKQEANNKEPQDGPDKKARPKKSHPCLRESISTETSEGSNIVKAKPKHHKQWNRRFKYICCCLSYKRNKDSITEVAGIMAEYFADLKVPTSDIAAGMVLLSKFQAAQQDYMVRTKQNQIEQILSTVPIKADTRFLDLNTAEDSHLLNDLIYFMNYSLAIFGWPLSLLEDPCTICYLYRHFKWSLCSARQRAQPPQTTDLNNNTNQNNDTSSSSNNNNNDSNNQNIADSTTNDHGDRDTDKQPAKKAKKKERQTGVLEEDAPIVEEDNCCGCNWASAENRLNEHNFEIIYITYHSDITQVPFLVAADHAKESIVVSIRGSMSMNDCVTDLLGQIDKLPVKDCPDDWLCHRGMTRSAVYIKNKLINERLLDRAFNCRPDWGSKEYNLVLCGHSLGAGTAAILGVLLREQYPKLRAYLYSPPGGILSLPLANYTKEFAVGIILGNDIVARLGLAQMERLRYQVLLALKNADRSTSRVLAKALCPSFCFGSNSVEYDPELSVDLLQSNSSRSFAYHGKEIPFQVVPSVLYVPGRLIHIVRNTGIKIRRPSVSGKTKQVKAPLYQAVWSTDNTIYDRIILCERMFMDHMPNRLMEAMKMLFIRTKPDRRESTKSMVQSNLSAVSDGPIKSEKASTSAGHKVTTAVTG